MRFTSTDLPAVRPDEAAHWAGTIVILLFIRIIEDFYTANSLFSLMSDMRICARCGAIEA